MVPVFIVWWVSRFSFLHGVCLLMLLVPLLLSFIPCVIPWRSPSVACRLLVLWWRHGCVAILSSYGRTAASVAASMRGLKTAFMLLDRRGFRSGVFRFK